MTKSKRRSERIRISLPVRWIKRSGDTNTTAADINLHGMFVRVNDLSVVPGQLLQLEVELPIGKVQMFAVARFVGRSDSGIGIGVEIFVMEEKQQSQWSNFYRSQIRQQKTVRVAVAR